MSEDAYCGASITELEIEGAVDLRGRLRGGGEGAERGESGRNDTVDATVRRNSFFYFREPGGDAAEQAAAAMAGEPGESDAAKARLEDLKARIVGKGFTVKSYTTYVSVFVVCSVTYSNDTGKGDSLHEEPR